MTTDEIIGKHVNTLYISGQGNDYRQFMRRAEMGENVEHVEVQGVKKYGSTIWVSRVTSAIRNNQGEVQGFCAIVEDVTQKVKLEKSRHEFISLVSHELRTPLTSIHGAIGLLRAIKGRSNKEMELLDVAYRNSDRLTDLINDILTVEKFELGVLKFDFEDIRLSHVVTDALSTAQQLAKKQQVEIVYEKNENFDPLVHVDRVKTIQVVLNFLSNAIKFSYAYGKVFVTIESMGDWVRLAVRDEGEGIPEEFKTDIFGKFSQANMGNTRQAQGTGLGLFISKSIIEGMGGLIDFESEQGKGSVFYFNLPLEKTGVLK